MKIIISLLASALVATMAIAQEESASPAESTAPTTTEEKPSATVESTPSEPTSSTGSQKKEETMSAAPAAAASAQKKEAPAAAKPATAKPATAASAAAPAAKAAAPAKNLNPKDAENAWEAAVAKHDSATVDGFLAADFTGVSSKNKFIGRSDVIGEFKKDKDTYKSAKNEKLNVKMYGNNVAVVTGRAREIGTGKDGQAFDRSFLFTDTWMMRGGKWQCVASHVTKIKG